MAAAISQETNEASDCACGVFSMELQAPTREELPINALARLDTEMGQQFLTQSHLDLARTVRDLPKEADAWVEEWATAEP